MIINKQAQVGGMPSQVSNPALSPALDRARMGQPGVPLSNIDEEGNYGKVFSPQWHLQILMLFRII